MSDDQTEDRTRPLPSPEDAHPPEDGQPALRPGAARFPTERCSIAGPAAFRDDLACSDSRVPPELVFDAGFGELFVVRVAGNVLGSAVAGTLQYATVHLRTPLFVVMGHQGCGAVKAALAAKFEGALHCERIELLLEGILPSLDDVDATLPAAALLDAAVEANVRRTVRQLRASPEGRAELASGAMKLVGAVYDLETGRVRFLE
jgi:carbonic anhydrase